ncbi:reverse transcriptase domain-containing protein [Tanacetum coccineum]
MKHFSLENLGRIALQDQKALDILKLSQWTYWGTYGANYSARKIFDQVSIGPPSTRMPNDFVTVVTFVNVRKITQRDECTKLIKFAKSLTIWGIDFMGPFPSSIGNKYILVAVDYLSKWVEAKLLPPLMPDVVCKFFFAKKSLFSRFGAPPSYISDHWNSLLHMTIYKFMLKYGVTHSLSTAYTPQTTGK